MRRGRDTGDSGDRRLNADVGATIPRQCNGARRDRGLAVVLSLPPPQQAGDAVLGGLQQGAPDRLRQRRVIELDAQIGLFGPFLVLRQAAPISAVPAMMRKSGAPSPFGPSPSSNSRLPRAVWA